MATYYKPHCKCDGRCKCDAKWYFKTYVGTNPKTGKRMQVKRGGFSTKKDAQDACAALLIDVSHGFTSNESKTTFKAFSDEWLNLYQLSGKVKNSTIRVRVHEINCLLPFFAEIPLKDITRHMYQKAIIELSSRLAENTVSGIHGTFRMIMKRAIEFDLLKRDPSEFVQLPKKIKTVDDVENEHERIKYLEKNELAKFLEVAKSHGIDMDYTIFLVLSYTGIRVGELCALKWKDIDFENGTISIKRTLYNPTNNVEKFELQTPKTATSIRTIDVDHMVLHQLKVYRQEQRKLIMRLRDTYKDMDFVFAKWRTHAGYPEIQKSIQTRMKRILKLAGLNESLNPHSLRHTHTSLLAEAGVDLQTIMERLGHKDDDTTKHVYLHITKPMKKDASHKFSQLMKSIYSGK